MCKSHQQLKTLLLLHLIQKAIYTHGAQTIKENLVMETTRRKVYRNKFIN